MSPCVPRASAALWMALLAATTQLVVGDAPPPSPPADFSAPANPPFFPAAPANPAPLAAAPAIPAPLDASISWSPADYACLPDGTCVGGGDTYNKPTLSWTVVPDDAYAVKGFEVYFLLGSPVVPAALDWRAMTQVSTLSPECTCAVPIPPTGTCDESLWQDVEHGVVCRDCAVLVRNWQEYRSCDAYCKRAPGGRQCAWRGDGEGHKYPMFFSNFYSNFWLILANFESLVLGCIDAKFCN